MTGSPLKADFDPDEEFDSSYNCGGEVASREPVLVGLEAGQARTLLSRLNTDPAIEDTEAWAFCSGSDNLQVSLSPTTTGKVVFFLSSKSLRSSCCIPVLCDH